MQVITTIHDMQALSKKLRSVRLDSETEGKTIGFVPTMGALHEGHLSLVRRSKEENDITVVSVFVNPTQFGPEEDLHQYPMDDKGDLSKLSSLHVDITFKPEARAMYPEGFSTSVNIGTAGEVLCGLSRPGHFNGVATVVTKLFHIVMPFRAYFGQKDFQQTVVIKKLVQELNIAIDIIVCPTVREPDGLAMSSRNSYLNREERKAAAVLYKSLKQGKALIESGVDNASRVRKAVEDLIRSEPLVKQEYVEIIDTRDLKVMKTISKPAAICLAAKIGTTRLIDNVIVE
jgi:pantoate--beta-alanine ligase